MAFWPLAHPESNLAPNLSCERYQRLNWPARQSLKTFPLQLFDHRAWRKRKHGYVRRVEGSARKTAYTLPGRSLIANTGCKALLSSGAASATAPLPT